MIYFARCGNTQWVKIGVATNVFTRLQQIQVYNPHRLRLMAVRYGGKKEESRLHKKFAAFNRHFEWFEISAELRAFIEKQIPAIEYVKRLPKGQNWWL